MACGPGQGHPRNIEDRLPRGDFESIRALLRVFFLLRKLEYSLSGMSDVRLHEADNTDPGLNPVMHVAYMDREGEIVDLSKRSHVQCRIYSGPQVRPGSSSSSPSRNQRPVFLIITPQVMSIAEVVVSDSSPGLKANDRNNIGGNSIGATAPPVSPTAATNRGLNEVRNTSVVPIHLVEAIIDGSNAQTLHLTVFSHDRPKLFDSIKYHSGDSVPTSSSNTPTKNGTSGVLALKCWRLSVGFANPAACSWTKATIEKHRAELRRQRLGRYCSLLGVADLANDSAL